MLPIERIITCTTAAAADADADADGSCKNAE